MEIFVFTKEKLCSMIHGLLYKILWYLVFLLHFNLKDILFLICVINKILDKLRQLHWLCQEMEDKGQVIRLKKNSQHNKLALSYGCNCANSSIILCCAQAVLCKETVAELATCACHRCLRSCRIWCWDATHDRQPQGRISALLNLPPKSLVGDDRQCCCMMQRFKEGDFLTKTSDVCRAAYCLCDCYFCLLERVLHDKEQLFFVFGAFTIRKLENWNKHFFLSIAAKCPVSSHLSFCTDSTRK